MSNETPRQMLEWYRPGLINNPLRLIAAKERPAESGDVNNLLLLVSDLEQKLGVARKELEDVAANYDCDEDSHKYRTWCRKCGAEETIAAISLDSWSEP